VLESKKIRLGVHTNGFDDALLLTAVVADGCLSRSLS